MRTKIVSAVFAILIPILAFAATTTPASRAEFVADGVAREFVFNFPAQSPSYIEVYLNGSRSLFGFTTTLNTSQSSSPGGKVVFPSPPLTGTKIRIDRTLPLTQTTVLPPYSQYKAKDVENTFDRVVHQIQQVARGVLDEHAAWTAALAEETEERIAADDKLRADFAATDGGFIDDAGIVASGSTTSRTLKDRFADIVNVKDYGAKGDGTTDDTASINAAFTAAVARARAFYPSPLVTVTIPQVAFPSGRYKISSVINATGRVVCWGFCSVEQTDDSAGIFSFAGRVRAEITGFTLVGGRFGVHFENTNLDVTTFEISQCEFHATKGYAIELLPTSPADHLSADVFIHDNRFYDPKQVLVNRADTAVFTDNWVSWHYGPTPTQYNVGGAEDNTAAIVNYSSVELIGFFGVPGPDWVNAQNMRWIDNYGSVKAYRCRFGGEGGGLPIIWNYAGHGDAWPNYGSAVIVRDSWLSPGNNFSSIHKDGVLILKTDIPGTIVIEDNFGLVGEVIRSEVPDLAAKVAATPWPHVTYRYTARGNQASGAYDQIPAVLRPLFVDQTDMQMPGVAAAAPTSGKWRQGQELKAAAPALMGAVGRVNTMDGSPGVWGEYGKISPFPVGMIRATPLAAHNGSVYATVTLPVPNTPPGAINSFTLLVTVWVNPNVNGSGSYGSVSTYFVTLATGYNNATDHVIQTLSYSSQMANAAAAQVGSAGHPALTSVHWGSGETGSATRDLALGGQITFVWDGCLPDQERGEIFIEPLQFGAY